MTPPVPTLVVWCPDWPVTAAGIASGHRAGVFRANRVLAASPAARVEGVRVGLTRRDAQRRCPDLQVVPADPARDARAFEPVVSALDAVTHQVEITEPGVCGFPISGPARWAGGVDALVELVHTALAGVVDGGARVGVADGTFAARLAARADTVVAPGATSRFLAPLPVSVLGLPDLADLLRRLGIRSLGAFAELPAARVVDRFGPEGAIAHRLARGLDERPPDLRVPPPDLEVTHEVDPPAERVDQAAFVAKRVADELTEVLAGLGLAATRVLIEAETEHGEVLSRCWRHEGAMDAAAIVERARWQIDGWLSGTASTRPSGGLSRLRLVPDDVVRAVGSQLGFWGSDAAAASRAARGVARIQGLLGPDAVGVPRPIGGRGPGERIGLTTVFPTDIERGAETSGEGTTTSNTPPDGPWPGFVPGPGPAIVWSSPRRVSVQDAVGRDVTVDGRGTMSASPSVLVLDDGRSADIAGWAGPWPADERWWDADAHRRRARCQVRTVGGGAHLVVREHGAWWVEGTYD